MKGWIGVDFDGTLSEYNGWVSADHCGAPIAPMVERVKRWLAEGRQIRVFTARCWPFYRPVLPGESLMNLLAEGDFDHDEFIRAQQAAQAILAIRAWCKEHIGVELPVTCVKDYGMEELWDDRAVAVEPNTGVAISPSRRGLE